jgi:hypothetical protein
MEELEVLGACVDRVYRHAAVDKSRTPLEEAKLSNESWLFSFRDERSVNERNIDKESPESTTSRPFTLLCEQDQDSNVHMYTTCRLFIPSQCTEQTNSGASMPDVQGYSN